MTKVADLPANGPHHLTEPLQSPSFQSAHRTGLQCRARRHSLTTRELSGIPPVRQKNNGPNDLPDFDLIALISLAEASRPT
jgi:hypothetical protein